MNFTAGDYLKTRYFRWNVSLLWQNSPSLFLLPFLAFLSLITRHTLKLAFVGNYSMTSHPNAEKPILIFKLLHAYIFLNLTVLTMFILSL